MRTSVEQKSIHMNHKQQHISSLAIFPSLTARKKNKCRKICSCTLINSAQFKCRGGLSSAKDNFNYKILRKITERQKLRKGMFGCLTLSNKVKCRHICSYASQISTINQVCICQYQFKRTHYFLPYQ